MKQSKLVTKVYRACIKHNEKEQFKLRKKEFVKIVKHKAQGKSFDTKWTLIRL